ncbi:hypothetical protein GCM10023144_25980 [Pigmentiphaga soli]|uniref:HTH luxR-type domain-containing protein n=1 Tax=Pigmentiphaga soli TaxID=1007095 RepID=A0ABP8H4F1_9BURK
MHNNELRGIPLTPREREVMAWMVRGKANKVIAGALGISIRTVEVHRARLMAKMGVRNAVELVVAMHARASAAPGRPPPWATLAEPRDPDPFDNPPSE